MANNERKVSTAQVFIAMDNGKTGGDAEVTKVFDALKVALTTGSAASLTDAKATAAIGAIVPAITGVTDISTLINTKFKDIPGITSFKPSANPTSQDYVALGDSG